MRDVLRLKAGDMVEIFDGEGTGYSGRVESCGLEVKISSLERLESLNPTWPRLVLAVALIRRDRFEWMLEKATELGASEFVPLVTRYCNLRIPDHGIEDRLSRWRKIVTEAARQSGRLDIPPVRRPFEFAAFLAAPDYRTPAGFMFFEGGGKRLEPASLLAQGAVLLVGPEGGWDRSEIDAAETAGYDIFSLGDAILRSETAAIAATAVLRCGLRGDDVSG